MKRASHAVISCESANKRTLTRSGCRSFSFPPRFDCLAARSTIYICLNGMQKECWLKTKGKQKIMKTYAMSWT